MCLAYAVGDVSLELQQFQEAEDHREVARKIAAMAKTFASARMEAERRTCERQLVAVRGG